MKKVFSLLLILSLAFGLTGCLTLNSDDHGVGKVIVSKDVNLMRPDSNGVMVPAKDPITVTINGEEKVLGEEFTLQDGTYEILFKSEGKYVIPAEENKVKVKAGENTVLNSLDENKMLLGQKDITLKFNPENYDFEVSENAKIQLVGTVWDNDDRVGDGDRWSPGADNSNMYFEQNSDEIYSITVKNVLVGKEYKVIINNDPENVEWGWEDPSDNRQLLTPDGLDEPAAANYKVKLNEVLSQEISEYEL